MLELVFLQRCLVILQHSGKCVHGNGFQTSLRILHGFHGGAQGVLVLTGPVVQGEFPGRVGVNGPGFGQLPLQERGGTVSTVLLNPFGYSFKQALKGDTLCHQV